MATAAIGHDAPSSSNVQLEETAEPKAMDAPKNCSDRFEIPWNFPGILWK
jgi:hypothetical protein